MSATESSTTLEKTQTQSPENTCQTDSSAACASHGGSDAHETKTGARPKEPNEVASGGESGTPAVGGDAIKTDPEAVIATPAVDKKGQTPSPNSRNALTGTTTPKPDGISVMPPASAPNPAVATGPVNPQVLTPCLSRGCVSVDPAPKTTASAAPLGAKVMPAGTSTLGATGQGRVATSLASVSQPGLVSVTAALPKVTRVVTVTPATGRGAAVPSRAPQTTSVQLPVNFQIPQGMVLIRSDSGQLMLVSQQALAQAQAQGIIPKPASTVIRAPAAQATATTIIRKADATPVIRVSLPSNSTSGPTVQKTSSTTGPTVLKISSTTGTIVQKTPASSTSGPTVQKISSTTGTTVIRMPVVKTLGGAVPNPSVTQTVRPVGPAPRALPPNIPTKATPPIKETLENVKKCKNFLVTLIKLASSGSRSADMATNVRGLVRSLLEGKLEAEEFADRLYTELKSSPQPYLVPFLKRSLPAVRQLTPNPQLFIQQCDQPKPQASSSTSTKPAPSITLPLKHTQPTRPTQLVIQQSRGVVLKQSVTSSPRVVLPVQNRTLPKHLLIQTHAFPTGSIVRPPSLQVCKVLPPQSSLPPAHTHSFKDCAAGSFRDEDDINDVASMAGVNLSEESARILATGSELVGSVIRSCRDEPFLPPATLHTRILDTGRSLGVLEVGADVLSLLSHATQERLRDLVEKLTLIAQHRSTSYRDDWRHRQTNDTRSQLKFLEQLEQLEKQRKEEEERETLLRIAKSRCNREDPEQLRLKQRAKEMQQLELAQMQYRDANLAALAALGPRKRRPLEACSPADASQVVGVSSLQRCVQRATRVTLRDLLFCMEQDPSLRRSLTLYNAQLK